MDRVAEKLVEAAELPWHPSFFEMMTAIAFEHFAREKVDLAVLEVGMGGRLDATNVVEPRVSVITDISLDHQKFLGEYGGRDCAGEGGNYSSGRRGGDAAAAARGQRRDRKYDPGTGSAGGECGSVCAAGFAGESPSTWCRVPETAQILDGFIAIRLQVLGEQILVETPLVGRHQLRNVALAIATAVELNRAGIQRHHGEERSSAASARRAGRGGFR